MIYANEYCSGTLQSLDLHSFKIPDNFTASLRPLFKNLKTLKVTCCTFEGASRELFADCGSLVELKICDDDNVLGFILTNTFPKLEQFEFDSKTDLDAVESFIPRHMNLKSLEIWNVVKSSMVPLIADCKRLEMLGCGIPDGATLDFTNLGHIKKLDISWGSENVTKTALGLANLNFLEHLNLCSMEGFVDSEDIRTLSQLQRLQTLELQYFTELQDWNQLGDLVQLTTLKIKSNEQVDLDFFLLVKRLSKLTYLAARIEMNIETYLRLVDVVRRRLDKTKLTFELFERPHDFDDIKYVLCRNATRNAHIVEITFAKFPSIF